MHIRGRLAINPRIASQQCRDGARLFFLLTRQTPLAPSAKHPVGCSASRIKGASCILPRAERARGGGEGGLGSTTIGREFLR